MRGGRVVTNARRDAVDAEVSHDERHSFADGEAVWSRRPKAGVKFEGPEPAGDGGNKAWSPRRARNKS